MTRSGLIVMLAVLAPLVLAAAIVTRPIGAGLWYPADAAQLRAAVEMYVNEADVGANLGRCRACIVPSGSYPVAGAVAAHAFKLMKPGDYDRVIIIAPSHHATFHGCSLPAVEAFRTPLGDVPLDKEAVRRLCWSPLFSLHTMRYKADPERRMSFEVEHAIEVVLPFLQVQLGQFRLVPILLGDLKDSELPLEDATLNSIARKIAEIVDERTLVVVSSNMTAYGNNYSFRPFDDNVLENIRRLDDEAVSYILTGDAQGFQSYLNETGNPIDGRTPIKILLKLLPSRAHGVLLSYATSGKNEAGQEPEHSVSYAAIGFFDSAARLARDAEPQPVKETPGHGHE